MKGTRAISFLLVFALMASLVVPGFFAQPARAEGTDNGMSISKTAKDNGDGTYTITLEAYATGSKVISQVKKDIPTDIVLVLDRSGSMSDPIKTTEQFSAYKDKKNEKRTRNQDYYEFRHNGGICNLWYKLGDSYVSVSVTAQETASYVELSTSLKNYTTKYQYGDDYYGDLTKDCYYYYANNLYEKVGEDSYQQVKLTESETGDWWNPTYTYTYTFSSDGTSVPSTGRATEPDLGDHAPLYYKIVNDTKTVYTYTYTDASGNVVTIGTSTGATTKPDLTLYERTLVSVTGGGSRLDALKTAAGGFVTAVADKAKGTDKTDPSDDVKHRLAVVSYAGNSTNNTNGLLDMTATGNVTIAQNAINGLRADGGTMIDSGINTANGIFAANPINSSDTNGRQRVLIVFTDGAPGSYGDWQEDSRNTANNAISYANIAKNTYGATVYTIGIFPGADASSPAFLPMYTESGSPNNAQQVANSNRFMHLLSSNYPQATSMITTGVLNSKLNGNSYYLSASDAGTLNNIFQQIASNIESGGSNTTLTEETVIKDIVAPQFTLPKGASASNITLKTYRYTGVDNTGVDTWAENENAMGANATVNGDRVSVTGFNFSENWCGTVTENGNTTYRGNKLVISFDVVPKTGFLGGNGVYTNTSAGVYENSEAKDPIMTFDRPKVDIAIGAVSVTPTDKNVYLLQDVSVDTLKSGAVVKVGDVSLDLSKNNYGLEAWQTAYVNITVEVKDASGNVIPADGLTGLTDDSTYSITVTVSPKNEGTVTAQSGNGTGAINVFKPVLTFMDSDVYYGATAPTDFSGNLVSTVWKHGETVADTATMGDAPELTKNYTPDSSKIENGKINTKQDIPVNVTASIGNTDVTGHTTFVHQDCVANENLNGGKFLLHVKTCQLTITKVGGASDEPYVFTVKKDGEKYSEVTVMGGRSETIVELPVGTYSIQEDTDWSWRYPNPSYSDNVTLSATNTDGTITCTNTKTGDFWLNGFSAVVKNIFNKAG